MAEELILPAEKQQEVYQYLQGVARAYSEDEIVATSGPTPSLPKRISNLDIFTLVQKGQKPGIYLLQSSGAKPIFVPRDDILQRVYALLRTRDQDHDGKIDPLWLGKDLALEEMPTESTAEESTRQILEKYRLAVFKVTPVLAGEESGPGTGFIFEKIRKQDGSFTYRVLTNAHVVDQHYSSQMGGEDIAEEIGWELESADERHFFNHARLVGMDPLADLAILEFDAKEDFPLCPLGSSKNVGIMDKVTVIGNTKGRGTVSVTGRISHTERGVNLAHPFPAIQIDASVGPGNSGSPVFAEDGTVVGVHFWSIRDSQIRYEIPIDRVKDSLKRMEACQGRNGVLYGDWGLALSPLRHGSRKQLLPENLVVYGVEIARVYKDSPASQAGIREGDILISINGNRAITQITRTEELFKVESIIRSSSRGQNFSLEIYRKGEGLKTVKLRAQEILFGRLETFRTSFGFSVYDISLQARRVHAIPKDVQGVWVVIEGEKSPHDGLEKHTVITEVNRTPVKDVREFRSVIEKVSQQKGTDISLRIYRSSRHYYVFLGGVGGSDTILIER